MSLIQSNQQQNVSHASNHPVMDHQRTAEFSGVGQQSRIMTASGAINEVY